MRTRWLASLAVFSACGPSLSGNATLVGEASHEGITVILQQGQGEPGQQQEVARTTTSPIGDYSFAGLPNGVYTLVVSAPSTVEKQVEFPVLVDHFARAPDAHLTPYGTVSGSVAVMSHWPCSVPTYQVVIDLGTRTSFPLILPPGAHSVAVTLDGVTTKSIPVMVVYNHAVDLGVVSLPAAAASTGISSRVVVIGGNVAQDGTELGTITPIKIQMSGGCSGSVLTDNTGRFTVSGLVAHQDYGFSADAPPVTFCQPHNHCLHTATSADTPGVVIPVSPITWIGAGKLSGRVTIGGKPIGTHTVMIGLDLRGGIPYGPQTAYAAPDGTYSLDYLAGPGQLLSFWVDSPITPVLKLTVNVPYLGSLVAPDVDL